MNVTWQVAVCRTLAGVSCPFDGSRPPTLLGLVGAEASPLDKTVVVECGYNDPLGSFADAVQESIEALLAAGVQHIFWVNYHAATPGLAAKNGILDRAAGQYPQVTLLDWNDDADGHYGWFQSDRIHLTYAGGVALATLLHAAVWESFAPPLVAAARVLPEAHVGIPYSAHVQVTGGRPPYTFRAVSGPLPPGLHLKPDGWIDGTPRRAGRAVIVFQATDSGQFTVLDRQQLTVGPGRV
jgi:hypothetical protein